MVLLMAQRNPWGSLAGTCFVLRLCFVFGELAVTPWLSESSEVTVQSTHQTLKGPLGTEETSGISECFTLWGAVLPNMTGFWTDVCAWRPDCRLDSQELGQREDTMKEEFRYVRSYLLHTLYTSITRPRKSAAEKIGNSFPLNIADQHGIVWSLDVRFFRFRFKFRCYIDIYC